MVKAKKHLGQHFLTDFSIAQRIAESLDPHVEIDQVLEIGPGTGALTQFLVDKDYELFLVDIDQESIEFLKKNYSALGDRIVKADFINDPLPEALGNNFALMGNFPYNISTQIMFRMLQYRERIPELVGMFQKEVAERLVAEPGSKKYGILSVLLKVWYDGEYLFDVAQDVFDPPPKVMSGVIRLVRNDRETLEVDEKLLKSVVKMAFNLRRKTLRNSLKSLINQKGVDASDPIFQKRPEQLSVEEFISLSKMFS